MKNINPKIVNFIMKFLLLLSAILGYSAFEVTDLTESLYNEHLRKKHIFVIACVQDDGVCQKFYSDFKKEWLLFFYRSYKGFHSQLFRLIKTAENQGFYGQISAGQNNNLLIYIEKDNDVVKKYLDPQLTSLEQLTNWFNQIEL